MYCNWCGKELDSSEQFRFEIDLAADRDGGMPFEEHPGLQTVVGPVPSCRECKHGIMENYDAILEEDQYVFSLRRFYPFLGWAFFGTFVIILIRLLWR